MMDKKKRFGVLLAAAMTASLVVPAMAADPTEEEKQANADTVISIFNTTVDPTNVSFEVPLYVTMAVVDKESDVVVPDNYGITNTSAHTSHGIAVTAMTFTKLAGSTYNTTTSSTGIAQDEIYLTIGNVAMPALDAAGTKTVDLKTQGSAFYDMGSGTYTKIDSNKTLDLPLAGKVSQSSRDDGNAVAQFKVTYVVSALDKNGDPVGTPYVGDDSEDAGLGMWNDDAGTWQ